MIETRHLRCFVVAAEELHFGRAALRLNMTQPPLSRQIQSLEQALKCELFSRSSRSVQLTQAGLTFLPEARRILRLIENASKAAFDVSAGRRGVVRCGFTASAAYEFLPKLVELLKEEMPEVTLRLREMVSRDQVAALNTADLDIGLSRAPGDLSGYEHDTVARERLIVALPANHPLLRNSSLTWRDLHQQDMLMHEPRDGQYFYNLVASRLVLDNIYPNFVQHLSQIHSMLALVRAGAGLAVVPAGARVMAMSGIEYREFSDQQVLTAELLVVWRPETPNPLVRTIAELARRCSSLPN